MSALDSKMWLNQKNKGILFIFYHLKIIWKDFFLFYLILEARAEILKNFVGILVDQRNQKDILKLTDL